MENLPSKRDELTGREFRSYTIGIYSAFKENRLAITGIGIIVFLILIAVSASWIAPHDPLDQQISQCLLPPSCEYPLGTDDMGRCVLSRLIYGTRTTLQLGFVVSCITAIAGTILGLVSGYFGGMVDELIMRITDVLLAFPGLILALVIAGLLGPGLLNVLFALSIVGWTKYARLARGCVLSVKERSFVEGAKAIGCGDLHVMIHYILPETISPVIVMATLGIGWAIQSIAALSFLGLGIQPPIPEWGAMLNSGRSFLRSAPHVSVFPGLAISLTVLSFNFIGDGLRDAMDPRLKNRVEI